MPETRTTERLPEFFFISQLIKDKVLLSQAGKLQELGRLSDLEIRLAGTILRSST